MATIAIIGSGFGGLAAAIRLAARGHAVEVFEQRDELGGRAGVYRRQGFTFDAGPTIITAPFLFDELWTLAGKRREDFVRFVPCAPFYRIFNHDGRVFEYDGDERSILEQIGRWNPGDQAGYRRFFAATEPIFRKGFVDLADKPFPRFTDMLRVAPDLIKMRADLSVYQFVSRYIQDDFLRRCFSFHPLLIGGNPFDAPSIYTMIHYLERHWGVHYVMGGTGALVSAMGDLLRDLGGNIHLTAPVAEILVDQRRVTGIRLASGERVLADAVVSNADVAYTYRTLIPEAHRRHNTNRKFESMRYGMSLYVLYFGTNRRYTDTALAHHNILFGPRYAGLLDDIFQRRVLADDFSLYLHMPSRTDPSVAPEGCEAFYVLAPVPHLGADIDWETAARPFRDAIVRFLEDRYLPGLSEAIVTELAVDPRHFAHDLNSYLGAAFSFEPTLTQSAWFRPHNRSEDFDNLYLVGAGTHPGAGLPGVLSSAKIAENLIAASGMPASGTTANGPRTRVRGRLGGKLEASR